MPRINTLRTHWWEPLLQMTVLTVPVVLFAVFGVLLLFDALFGDEFSLGDATGSADLPFVVVVIYLGVMGGYLHGSTNGYEAGERYGREQEREPRW